MTTTTTSAHRVPSTTTECWLSSSSRSRTHEFLGALHAILGTALFFFGKIVSKEPALALAGERTNALPYWLSALDVFESGHALPVPTDVSCPNRVHWLLAISGSRVLVALIGQFLAAAREHGRWTTTEVFVHDTEWARNSPLGTIVAMRPPPTQRMALSLMAPGELMLVAADQFMRGILHMPHRPTTDFPFFSRAGKLLIIATEVLEVVERLPSLQERRRWVSWVLSILDLVKPDMVTERQSERCALTRARCRSLIDAHHGSEIVVEDKESKTSWDS